MHHDVELTKKGEAYVLRHNPSACPEGIEPRLWRKAVSKRVEAHLALATALLALLDGFDGDCDLEETGELEPSLGGLQIEGEVDLEADWADSEPSLGWTAATAEGNQALIATEMVFTVDGEVDILDEPHDEELGI